MSDAFKSQAQRRKFAAGASVHKNPVRSVGEGQELSVSLTPRKRPTHRPRCRLRHSGRRPA